MWFGVLFWSYKAQIVHCFSVIDKTLAKQAILFDFHNMVFKNFWLEVANKIPLSTQSLALHALTFPVKKVYFLRLQNFVSQRICYLLCQRMNALKIIWNWFLTLQAEVLTIIYQYEQNKWYWHNMGT